VFGDRSGIDQAVRYQLTVGNAPSAIQMGSPGNVAALDKPNWDQYSASLIPKEYAPCRQRPIPLPLLPRPSSAMPSSTAGGEQ
jgi:hypothetical protein